jgi:hypothetical protein
MSPPPSKKTRLAGLLRLLSALALLAAVLVFFELPLRALATRVGQDGNPLAGLFGPAKGFLARIGSQPSGAAIRIDGKARGETPFLGNVACGQGDKVLIEIAAPGYQTWRRELECRVDGQLEIDARLAR